MAEQQHWLIFDPEDEAGQFRAHEKPNNWVALKLARAEASGNDVLRAAAMWDFLMTVVDDEERGRLDDYLTEHGREPDLLEGRMEKALDDWRNGVGLPLEPGSDSSTPSTGNPGTSEEDSSQPDTPDPALTGEVIVMPKPERPAAEPDEPKPHLRYNLQTGAMQPIVATSTTG
jgi:hypothetical protein